MVKSNNMLTTEEGFAVGGAGVIILLLFSFTGTTV
jgi:hypothetical protein